MTAAVWELKTCPVSSWFPNTDPQVAAIPDLSDKFSYSGSSPDRTRGAVPWAGASPDGLSRRHWPVSAASVRRWPGAGFLLKLKPPEKNRSDRTTASKRRSPGESIGYAIKLTPTYP
jgi:hypothetical protein